MDGENEGFNIHAAADEIIAEGDSQSSSTDDSSQSEGQSTQDSQTTEENTDLSAEEILNQVGQEKEGNPEQFADLLKLVGGLGAVHHGAPIKVDSPEQLKKLLEMGAGFYQKTETHANEVKAKEAEFQQKETAYQEREQAFAQKEQAFEQGQQFNNLMMDLMQDMQTSDPELFEHLDALFTSREKALQQQSPIIKKYEAKFAEYDKRFESQEQQKQSEELKGIKQSWEKDLSEVQTKVAASLSKLGVVPDWKKVQETWTADASGKMSVEQALYATYGVDIQKAHQSQLKLLETKNKTNAKLLGRTGVGQGQRGKGETIEATAIGDYGSILRQASQTM